MRVFLIALLLSLPALAQERPSDFDDPYAVPSPIPPNFCVEVHWPAGSFYGKRIAIHLPPLDEVERSAMESVRRDGKAVLRRCALSDL